MGSASKNRRMVLAGIAAAMVGGGLALVPHAQADSRAEVAWQDAGVRQASPQGQHGAQPTASVSHRTAFFYAKFNTTVPRGSRLSGATLYVTVLRSAQTALAAHSVPGGPYDWDASTLRWVNQPALSSTVLGQTNSGLTAGERYAMSIPVTALDVTTGDTDLRLSATAPGTYTYIATAEHPDASQRPQLVLRYETSTPSPSATATTVRPSTTASPSTSTAPTSTPPTSTPPTSPTPTATPSGTDCRASLTTTTGIPWRSGSCANPGYANAVIPSAPVLQATDTARVRQLPGAIVNIDEYTEPIYYASNARALRRVNCVLYACVGGTSAPLTGSEVVAPGSDGLLVVIDPDRRRSYDMYQVATDPDGTVRLNADGSVDMGSLSVVDLDGRGNKTADGTNLNITGAGVSRAFGVIRASEVRAAATNPATAIPHALQVSLPINFNCASGFREPATKTDGRASGNCIVEGARLQLDPAVDCRAVATNFGQAVCAALQKYGAYDMDNNGSPYLAVYAQHRRSTATGVQDFAAVGITGDYQGLGIPMDRLRVLANWHGR